MVGPALVLLLAQPPASACVAADEPEFAVLKENAVQVGGGAMYAASRERRYLDALRGPMGETVQYRRTGSLPIDREGRTILDQYELTYGGLEKPLVIYLDAYHFDDALKAPKGFTCAVPFGLNPPGPDPMLAMESMVELAVEQGPAKEMAPISLDADGSATHGVIFDRFRRMARAARTAAREGTPIDASRPPREFTQIGMVIVAHPLRCGDGKDPVSPANIEIVPSQGPAPQRIGDLAIGDALSRLLPNANLPAGSMAAAYPQDHPRAIDSIKVSYAPGCGEARDVLLPLTFANAKPLNTPMPRLPDGQAATDRPIRLQALLDMDGAAQRIIYKGGPAALSDAAIAAVRTWTAEPMRLNGAPLVTPVTFQVKFRSR